MPSSSAPARPTRPSGPSLRPCWTISTRRLPWPRCTSWSGGSTAPAPTPSARPCRKRSNAAAGCSGCSNTTRSTGCAAAPPPMRAASRNASPRAPRRGGRGALRRPTASAPNSPGKASSSKTSPMERRPGGARSDVAGTNHRRALVTGGPAIILVEPQLGENIGTAARAMMNCGLDDLRLVRPREGWPSDKAISAASGADAVLAKARLFADTVPTVPLNPAFCSLNLAQAVLIVGYEWFTAATPAPPELLHTGKSRPATKEELANFLAHLEQALAASGFLRDPAKRPRMMRNLKSLFQRARCTEQEIRTLHGIVTAFAGPRRRADPAEPESAGP